MKAKKVFALITAVLMMVMFFAGCNDNKDNSTSGSGSSGATTTLTLWSFTEVHTKFYESMAVKWNEENPTKKIKLETTVLPYEDMHNKLVTTLTSTGAPDLCDIEVSKFSNFLKGTPALVPLNTYVDKYRSSLVKSRLDIYAKDDKEYGAPTHVGATVMYYNTELLERAGVDYTTIKTWGDYRKAAKTVKEKTGKNMGLAETQAAWTFTALITQQGGDLTNAEGNPDLTNDKAIASAQLMQDMIKDETLIVCPGGQPDNEEAKGFIASGNVGSVLMPLWYMSRFTDEMADNTGKWAIAPVPTIETGQPRSLGLGGTGTVVTNQCKNQELAAEFIVWAKCSPEGVSRIWTDMGFDPVNKDVWNDKALTHDESNKYIKYFKTNPFDVLNEVKDEIQLVKNTIASPEINSVLTSVTLFELFVDKKDPRTVLKAAQDTVETNIS